MKVLLTGSDGFIGKNLEVRLSALGINVVSFTRNMFSEKTTFIFDDIDFVFHIAGVNRPQNEIEFKLGNVDLTQKLCDAITLSRKKIPILFTSSVQALLPNAYGLSKLEAENILKAFQKKNRSPLYIYRLKNVFGKWSKPNYNSVVATFCHNIANNLPIKIDNEKNIIDLVYIDDVIKDFIFILKHHNDGIFYREIFPVYKLTIGKLAEDIIFFESNYQNIESNKIANNFLKRLYITYESFKSGNK
jgi:UDP-2-acetamido-2,6-beta-L-arabino-hexul-4-ose reductase